MKAASIRARLLLKRLPAVLWTTDLDLTLTSARGAGMEPLGLCEVDLVGRPLRELIRTHDAAHPVLQRHARALAGEPGTCRFAWQGRWYESRVEPLREQGSEITGAIGIAHEQTPGLDARGASGPGEEQHRLQRLETAGRLAGRIADDFDDLLAPLAVCSGRLRAWSDDPAFRRLVAELEGAASGLAEINQLLLALSRRGRYRREPLDLNSIVRDTLQVLRLPAGVCVELDLHGGLPPVRGGAVQLVRVLTNLGQNAVEAMPAGGTLTLRTEAVELAKILSGFNSVAPGQYVRVDVADDGCGIGEDIRDRIFDPFFTTKEAGRQRGAGLGLAVVHGLVEDHGGVVTFESRPGCGSTFQLFLPALDALVPVRPPDAARHAHDCYPPRVLRHDRRPGR